MAEPNYKLIVKKIASHYSRNYNLTFEQWADILYKVAKPPIGEHYDR